MLDANALKLMLDTAKLAAAPVKLATSDCETDHFVINGEVQTIERDAPVHVREFSDLDDLLSYAESIIKLESQPATGDNETEPSPEPVPAAFWVDGSARRVVLEHIHTDYISEPSYLELVHTKAFELLSNLAQNRQHMDPRALATLFRVDLNGLFVSDDAGKKIIAALRAIDFTETNTTSINVSRTKASVDKSMAASITEKAGELPEELLLYVPVFKPLYAGYDEAYEVKCVFLIDHGNARIALVPLPGELDKAELAAVHHVAGRILDRVTDEKGEATIPVYEGSGPAALTKLITANCS